MSSTPVSPPNQISPYLIPTLRIEILLSDGIPRTTNEIELALGMTRAQVGSCMAHLVNTGTAKKGWYLPRNVTLTRNAQKVLEEREEVMALLNPEVPDEVHLNLRDRVVYLLGQAHLAKKLAKDLTDALARLIPSTEKPAQSNLVQVSLEVITNKIDTTKIVRKYANCVLKEACQAVNGDKLLPWFFPVTVANEMTLEMLRIGTIAEISLPRYNSK